MRKYRIKLSNRDSWSKTLDLKPLMERWTSLATNMGGPYRLRQRDVKDAEWSPARALSPTKKRLNAHMIHGTIGEIWLTDTVKTPNISTMIVDVKPDIPDSPGTKAIDIVRWQLFHNFNLESWGICVCKDIAGSSSYSQHAYCNAEDYHAIFTIMSNAAHWLATNAAKDIVNFPAAEIIFNRQIWTPSQGWHYYGGINPHTDHIHVSGYPLQSGSNLEACH
jgi:hypothetical protein